MSSVPGKYKFKIECENGDQLCNKLSAYIHHLPFMGINDVCKSVDENKYNLTGLREIASNVVLNKTKYSLVELRYMSEYINDAANTFKTVLITTDGR